MADERTAPQRPQKKVAEVRACTMSFAGLLDQDETLTGTPSVAVSPSGLTAASPAVNTTTLTVNGRQVAVGMAVTYTVSGGTAGVDYAVEVTAQTTHGQTLVGPCVIPVIA